MPPLDAITGHVLGVYRKVVRSRRYATVGGLEGTRLVPLPLTVRDITDTLEAHPTPLCREEIDTCVFALDAVERELWG